MKKPVIACTKNIVFLLCALLLFGCEGLGGGDATTTAQKDIKLKRLQLILDKHKASQASGDAHEVPISFRGSFRNIGKRHYESVTISWFYRYRSDENRGEFIVDDVKAGEQVDLSGEEVSSVTLPGFAGGVLQTELKVSQAKFFKK